MQCRKSLWNALLKDYVHGTGLIRGYAVQPNDFQGPWTWGIARHPGKRQTLATIIHAIPPKRSFHRQISYQNERYPIESIIFRPFSLTD